MTKQNIISTFLDKKISFPFSPQTRDLFTYLLRNGDELRVVGGAVRDFLVNKKITNVEIGDIDLACKYHPNETSNILEQNQVRVFATGIKYGTITAIIDKEQFQITTLRRDIKKFGRNCEVEFVDDYFEDAKRRDFTINALSIDFSGRLYDYFGGFEDLNNQIVKFIGDANERISEDYLRILRFFRFSCFYAKNINQEGFLACIKYKNHLGDLSGERIRAEFFKMFECKNRDNLFFTLKTMGEAGILEIIFDQNTLPTQQKTNHSNTTRKQSSAINPIKDGWLVALKNLFALENFLGHPFTNLVILAVISDKIETRLSLSNAEKEYLRSITRPNFVINFKIQEKELLKLLLKFDQKKLIDIFTIQLVLNNNFENLIGDFLQLRKVVYSSQIPYFPINGYDLIDLKIKPQDIGRILEISKNYWAENNFSVNKQQILFFIKNNCV